MNDLWAARAAVRKQLLDLQPGGKGCHILGKPVWRSAHGWWVISRLYELEDAITQATL